MRGRSWCARIVLLGATWCAARTVAAQEVPVTHLTLPALEGATALRLAEPLELFAGTGADSTSRIRDMEVTETGEVHLFDLSRSEVRVLDTAGRAVRTLQVPVRGPGAKTLARDTLLALRTRPVPRSLGRLPRPELHVIDASDTAEPQRGTLPVEFTGGGFRLWATRSGWVLGHPEVQLSSEPGSGPLADSMILSQLDPVGFEVQRKVAFPLASPRHHPAPDFFLHEVMALYPTYDVARDGRIYTNVEGGYVIGVHGPSGTLERRIVGEVTRVPFTDEEFRAWIEARVAHERERAREGECRRCGENADLLERHAPSIGHADLRPVLGEIVADAEGRFAVRRLDLEEKPSSPFLLNDGVGPVRGDHATIWDIMDVEEGLIGRLRTPVGTTIAALAWPHVYLRFGDTRANALVRFRIAGAEGH